MQRIYDGMGSSSSQEESSSSDSSEGGGFTGVWLSPHLIRTYPVDRSSAFQNPDVQRAIPLVWSPGIRLRGVILRESTGNTEAFRGIVKRLDSEYNERYFFYEIAIVGADTLLPHDEVTFQLLSTNEAYVSIIALKKRRYAYGVVSRVSSSHIFLEIFGINNELSVEKYILDPPLRMLRRGSEIKCQVQCYNGIYLISDLKRYEPNFIFPLVFSQNKYKGVVIKPIYHSFSLTNPSYYGYVILTLRTNVLGRYGLLSQRNRQATFRRGDYVSFRLALFSPGSCFFVYDMVVSNQKL